MTERRERTMNRGGTITVQILGSGISEVEEISLPVALHSPLEVLRDQLATLSEISKIDQVLILCDLTDAERNRDVLLAGRDHMTLRDCGIKNGSVLTLHALGMSAEKKQLLAKEALQKMKEKENRWADEKEEVHVLETHTAPHEANHSYNGIIFDIETTGAYEVDILSLSFGGMLGRVRIFARDRPWEADKPQGQNTHHWWAHQESVSSTGWEVVADVTCKPAWDKVRMKSLSKIYTAWRTLTRNTHISHIKHYNRGMKLFLTSQFDSCLIK